jgi:ABC-type uncharacterized transport system substrate-binding protein
MRRSLILGGVAVGVAAVGGRLLAQPTRRRVAFVGDAKHYFEIEHPRVLNALGEAFATRADVSIESFPIDYEDPHTLASVADALAKYPPDFVAVIGDPEAQYIRAAIPRVPMIFSVNHDGSMLGLSRSISEPSELATGHCGDQLEHVIPLHILRDIFPQKSEMSIAIAAARPWFSSSRMFCWNAAAKALGITLRAVDTSSFEMLKSSDEWRSAGDFSGWILPLSRASVTRKTEIINHLNESHTVGFFERFTATQRGAPFAYASTSLIWQDYFALAIKLLVSGVEPSQVPIRNVTAWRYAANAVAARDLGLVLPDSVISRIHAIY